MVAEILVTLAQVSVRIEGLSKPIACIIYCLVRRFTANGGYLALLRVKYMSFTILVPERHHFEFVRLTIIINL